MEDLQFFNPYEDLRITENRLPHWQQIGSVYFVTFHLADSIPNELLTEWHHDREAWLRIHPPPWKPEVEQEYHQRFSGARERWLDAGHGKCPLRDPLAAAVVGQALMQFEGERFHSLAWVVMPNHVHALFAPSPHWTLENLLHSWKSFSAHLLQRRCALRGRVWMRDYFDRLVRDTGHLENCIRYIRRNPEKAGLRKGEYLWWESEMAREVE